MKLPLRPSKRTRERKDSTRFWSTVGRADGSRGTHRPVRAERALFRVICGSPSGTMSGTWSRATPSRSTAMCVTRTATARKEPQTGWRAAGSVGNDPSCTYAVRGKAVLDRWVAQSAPTHHTEQGWLGRFKYLFLSCSRISRARKISSGEAITGTTRLGSLAEALAVDGEG